MRRDQPDASQSVNTLKRRGRAVGTACNTDVAGFLAPLKDAADAQGMRATVLGAGGAARAVGVALAQRRRASAIAARAARARTSSWRLAIGADGRSSGRPRPKSWDVLVNATPVGTCAGRRRDAAARTARSAGISSTTSSTTRPKPGCCATRGRPGAGRSAAWTMLVGAGAAAVRMVDRRAHRSAGDARCRDQRAGREIGGCEGASGAAGDMKLTTFDEFVDLAKRGTFVPVVQGDRRRPSDAGLGVPEDRRALRLRLPARERRRRRARRPLLVPRQGSVPDPARARRRHADRACRRDDDRRQAVHRDAARADERLPVAVRARSAALHRRRGRLSRLRHRQLVRAGRRSRRARTADGDDAGFMLFDTVLAFDHVQHRILLIANARISGDEDLRGALPVRLREDRFPRTRARARAVAAAARRPPSR